MPTQKWEYRVSPVDAETLVETTSGLSLPQLLERIGDEGWELVSLFPASAYGVIVVCKRPKGK